MSHYLTQAAGKFTKYNMKCLLTTPMLRISRPIGTENIYLQNLKKIFLFPPVVSILWFLCCQLLLGLVRVWQNSTVRKGRGSRQVFIKDFANYTLSFL